MRVGETLALMEGLEEARLPITARQLAHSVGMTDRMGVSRVATNLGILFKQGYLERERVDGAHGPVYRYWMKRRKQGESKQTR